MGLSDSATDEERAVADVAIVRAEAAVIRHLGYDPARLERTEYYPRGSGGRQSSGGVWEVSDTTAYLRRLAEAADAELQVQHIPIRSVASLHVDHNGRGGTQAGAFGDDTLKTEGSDFWPNYDAVDGDGNGLCRDGIVRSAGAWPTTPGTVKLVYTAGYTAKELHGQCPVVNAASIMDAVIDESTRRAKKVMVNKKQSGAGFAAGPITGERLGDYSWSGDVSTMSRLFGGLHDILPETKEKLRDYVNVGFCLG